MTEQGQSTAAEVRVGQSRVLYGTCSWTDPTLVKDSDWYPKATMTAAERLAFYAARFPLVEVDSTYYFPPRPELARQWVDRTSPAFTMNVKAWSLMTGHPTDPKSLGDDLRAELAAEAEGKRRIYAHHLPTDAQVEAWARFEHALRPLADARRLGAVLLQYPEWFTPKRANREELAEARRRLPDYRLAVEFRNARWLAEGEAERTLDLLRDLGLGYVCVDEPQGFPSSVPPLLAATTDLAMVRFHGHNAANWAKKGITAAERFAYLYDGDELEAWVPKVHQLAEQAAEVHLLMNNCYQDYGVRNARELGDLLMAEGAEAGG